MCEGNRADPENATFETVVPRNLNLHTIGNLYTSKKC